MNCDKMNLFGSYEDLIDSRFEIFPMADFESYKVFGAIMHDEYIPGTKIAVEPKFFNHVSFLPFGENSIYNPVIVLNGQRLRDIDLWTITYEYKHEKYAVVSFNIISPQYKGDIIRQITGDNDIYTISKKYHLFIKRYFFTQVVWQQSYNKSLYDAGYRIIPPEYVFDHFDEFSKDDRKRFNEIFRGYPESRIRIRKTIQNANYNDKLRFAQRYLKAIVELKTEYTNETC